MVRRRLTTHDGDWKITLGILEFFTRPELERYQLEVSSRDLRKVAQGVMIRSGLLRYIDYVNTASFGFGHCFLSLFYF